MALSYYSRPIRLIFIGATTIVAITAAIYSIANSFLLAYKILLILCSGALLYETILSLSLQAVTPDLANRMISLLIKTTRRGHLQVYFYATTLVACGLVGYEAFMMRQISIVESLVLLVASILVIWDETQSLYMSYIISLVADDDEKGEKKKK